MDTGQIGGPGEPVEQFGLRRIALIDDTGCLCPNYARRRSVLEIIMADLRQEPSQRARLSGSRKDMLEFLQAHQVEAFDIHQDGEKVSLVVHLSERAIEAARRVGLTVAVQVEDTLLTQKLPVGRGNRFASGGIPQGLGLPAGRER